MLLNYFYLHIFHLGYNKLNEGVVSETFILSYLFQDVHHGNGTQEIFDESKSVSSSLLY